MNDLAKLIETKFEVTEDTGEIIASVSLTEPCERYLNAMREFEKAVENCSEKEQIYTDTHHTLHGGVYSRTVFVKKGSLFTTALVKKPTTLILNGNINIFVGGKVVHLKGHRVIMGLVNRKSVIYAVEDSYGTLAYATEAKTVEEAERELTDDLLNSSLANSENKVLITDQS